MAPWDYMSLPSNGVSIGSAAFAKLMVTTNNQINYKLTSWSDKVAKSFICRGCLNPVTSAVRTSVDIGVSAKLELVDKFCYLGDMLSVDGDADAAVEARKKHMILLGNMVF